MAYKFHVKKLSSDEQKFKQARHERRMAKALLAELPRFPPTEHIEEMVNTALKNLHSHVGSILKTDYPEVCGLMGTDFFETVKRFHDASMHDTLRAVMGQCEEELEELSGMLLLSFAAEHGRAKADNESANSEGMTA